MKLLYQTEDDLLDIAKTMGSGGAAPGWPSPTNAVISPIPGNLSPEYPPTHGELRLGSADCFMCRWARDCRNGTDRRLLGDQGVPVADRGFDYEQGGFKNQRESPGDGRQLAMCLGFRSVKAPPAPTVLPGNINTGPGT